MFRKAPLLFLLLQFSLFYLVQAQVVNTGFTDNYDSLEIGKVTVGGYVDTYYGFDFNQPKDSDRPYCVSSPRHNEVNINLAYVDIQYKNERIRCRLVPGFGTYINSNYAAEKGSLKNIVEANAGVKIFKDRNIWIDAGVLGSPYTNESAISKDHLMYTRSFAPEYVPYYLAGVKLSAPLSPKLNCYLYVLNGWQQISDVNNPLSVGTQLEYRPNNKALINWNTYVGDENSIATPKNGIRYFSDVYLIYNPEGKISITSCVYAGLQKLRDSTGKQSESYWWQANFIARYKINPKVSLSGRVEYFKDPGSVQIVPITKVKGFNSYSSGLCLNVKITKNALFRLEDRLYFSGRNIFINPKRSPTHLSNLLITNLTIWF